MQPVHYVKSEMDLEFEDVDPLFFQHMDKPATAQLAVAESKPIIESESSLSRDDKRISNTRNNNKSMYFKDGMWHKSDELRGKNGPEEQRLKRLNRERIRVQNRRKNETTEQSEARLSRERIRVHIRRSNGTVPKSKEELSSQTTRSLSPQNNVEVSRQKNTFGIKQWVIHPQKGIKAKPHKCSLCQAEFLLSTSLEAHVTKVHGNLNKKTQERQKETDATNVPSPPSYICPTCGQTGIEPTLQLHLRNTGSCPGYQFHCSICNVYFNSESKMNEHSHKIHHETLTYNCPYCPDKFEMGIMLQAHITVHNVGVRKMENRWGKLELIKEIGTLIEENPTTSKNQEEKIFHGGPLSLSQQKKASIQSISQEEKETIFGHTFKVDIEDDVIEDNVSSCN